MMGSQNHIKLGEVFVFTYHVTNVGINENGENSMARTTKKQCLHYCLNSIRNTPTREQAQVFINVYCLTSKPEQKHDLPAAQ